MGRQLLNRTWLSPVVAVAFAAVGVTGTLMLFHVRVPSIKVLHEWMGLVLALSGTVHVVLNWKPFWAYLRQRTARIALGVVFAFGVALAIAGADADEHGGHPHADHGQHPLRGGRFH